MGKGTKPTTIISASLGAGCYLLERGFDMAGIMLPFQWALVLWIIGGFLILFAFVVAIKVYIFPFLRTIRIMRIPQKQEAELKAVQAEETTPKNIREEIESSQVVWGCWHTGAEINRQKLVKTGKIKKILLLNIQLGYYQSILFFAEFAGRQKVERAISEIKELTSDAIANGISVKWYDTPQPNTFTICDPTPNVEGNEVVPNSSNAWITILVSEPLMEGDKRQKIRIEKKIEPERFDKYLEWYRKMWNDDRHTKTPQPEEYEL